MSGHVAPPIYEYNDEVISDEFFLDESDILHELSMDDEDLPDVDDDSETEHVGMKLPLILLNSYFYLSIYMF